MPILERLSAISEYICNSLAVPISRNKYKMKTIAIITKDKKETSALYNSLTSENTNISFIKNNIDKNSIAILPSYMAKGLEFDGVIAYNSPKNKLFYVVCTRAQHQLIVYNQPQKTLNKNKALVKKFII